MFVMPLLPAWDILRCDKCKEHLDMDNARTFRDGLYCEPCWRKLGRNPKPLGLPAYLS